VLFWSNVASVANGVEGRLKWEPNAPLQWPSIDPRHRLNEPVSAGKLGNDERARPTAGAGSEGGAPESGSASQVYLAVPKITIGSHMACGCSREARKVALSVHEESAFDASPVAHRPCDCTAPTTLPWPVTAMWMQLVCPATGKLSVDVQHSASHGDVYRTGHCPARRPVSTALLPLAVGAALCIPLAAVELCDQECRPLRLATDDGWLIRDDRHRCTIS
jgi:hypothetical protein